jgi:acyl-CoA synthetase (AMP-forming)/AMP-acid ligase II
MLGAVARYIDRSGPLTHPTTAHCAGARFRRPAHLPPLRELVLGIGARGDRVQPPVLRRGRPASNQREVRAAAMARCPSDGSDRRGRWRLLARGGGGAAAVASFLAAVLTEIYLCSVCSCPEILRRNGRGQGERGEIVLGMGRPFPSMARTIWGDKKAFETGSPHWRGNLNAWRKTYFHSIGRSTAPKPSGGAGRSHDAEEEAAAVAAAVAEVKEDAVDAHTDGSGGAAGLDRSSELLFVQGDWAQFHDDGTFSFHGRSDDVINVGGQRIGTGEIEAALFKHKRIHGRHSALANCGESKRPVVESPWSQFTSECHRF